MEKEILGRTGTEDYGEKGVPTFVHGPANPVPDAPSIAVDEPPPETVPDGGFRAWLQVLGCFFLVSVARSGSGWPRAYCQTVVQSMGIYLRVWNISRLLRAAYASGCQFVNDFMDWKYSVILAGHIRLVDGTNFRLGLLYVPHMRRSFTKHVGGLLIIGFYQILVHLLNSGPLRRVWLRSTLCPNYGTDH